MTQREVQKGWTESLNGVIVLNVMSSYTDEKVGLDIKRVWLTASSSIRP